MTSPLLLGIDEGTSAVKAALYDTELRLVAHARRETPLSHPAPGWVQQDGELILEAVVDAVAELLAQVDARRVVAAGLDHQGESVLAWEAGGRALTPVLVWQDKRQLALLREIDERSVASSGLPLDPYFSAGKLAWLLANDREVSRAREQGTLRMGTVDAFISDRLGGRFATDLSTASRTQLLAVGGRDWDESLLGVFGVRREWLPKLEPTVGVLGELRHERWPVALALTAQLVDQQAALAGSGATAPGQLKATYGTGAFVLGRTPHPVGNSRLLPTVAWALPGPAASIGEIAHALEGGVFSAGSLLDWLARDLGLAEDAAALAASAADVPDSAGVTVLPALAGLGAPWWRPTAHGVLAGLHPEVRPAHVARAALEAIAWRVADIVEEIGQSVPVRSLRVDGGLTADATLLQVQADAVGLAVTVGPTDTTVLGAALLAGVGAGVHGGVEQAAALLPPGRTVDPLLPERSRADARERWRDFVRATAGL
jgi:glycerol kinase